jgi:hypothetical protein
MGWRRIEGQGVAQQVPVEAIIPKKLQTEWAQVILDAGRQIPLRLAVEEGREIECIAGWRVAQARIQIAMVVFMSHTAPPDSTYVPFRRQTILNWSKDDNSYKRFTCGAGQFGMPHLS